VEAERFGMSGKGGGAAKRFAGCVAFGDGDEVQNGKTGHGPDMGL
jgi:hypothetical protein